MTEKAEPLFVDIAGRTVSKGDYLVWTQRNALSSSIRGNEVEYGRIDQIFTRRKGDPTALVTVVKPGLRAQREFHPEHLSCAFKFGPSPEVLAQFDDA